MQAPRSDLNSQVCETITLNVNAIIHENSGKNVMQGTIIVACKEYSISIHNPPVADDQKNPVHVKYVAELPINCPSKKSSVFSRWLAKITETCRKIYFYFSGKRVTHIDVLAVANKAAKEKFDAVELEQKKRLAEELFKYIIRLDKKKLTDFIDKNKSDIKNIFAIGLDIRNNRQPCVLRNCPEAFEIAQTMINEGVPQHQAYDAVYSVIDKIN